MAKKLKTMQIGALTIKPLAGTKLELSMAGKKSVVEYKELWAILFVLGDKKHQDEMMPVQKKEMMVFSRKHVIQASRDIKAGESVTVWCEVNIPKTIVEAIAEENGAKVILQAPPQTAEVAS